MWAAKATAQPSTRASPRRTSRLCSDRQASPTAVSSAPATGQRPGGWRSNRPSNSGASTTDNPGDRIRLHLLEGAAPAATDRPHGIGHKEDPMQTDLPTMTAACEVLGRHAGTGPAACKGVVLSLTEAHGTDCACSCHGRVRDLPDPWKAMA